MASEIDTKDLIGESLRFRCSELKLSPCSSLGGLRVGGSGALLLASAKEDSDCSSILRSLQLGPEYSLMLRSR